jgi:multiple sugar transport system ATP-binding protein
MLGVADLTRRKPAQLSGGQRQRVAMGRAIVREPAAFLMDEPLSNLDAKLRVEMRTYIALLHRKLNTTTVYVTHDQTEAMTLGDRVALMRDGRLEQVDVPAMLYAKPANLFVAGFMGSPAMNIVHSRLIAEGGSVFAELGPTKLRLAPSFLKGRRQLEQYIGHELILGIRPEDIEDAAFAPTIDGEASLDVQVALAEPMGSEVIVHFPVDAEPVAAVPSVAAETDSKDRQELAQLIAENPARNTTMVARLNSRTTARTGKPARLTADVSRLYFFDPISEAAIR